MKQEHLLKAFSCQDKSKTICFEGAEFYSEYNIYIFNFKVEISDENLKGLTVEQYIDDTMGPIYGLINPKAAEFYGIDPIMREIIDEREHPASNIILGMTTNYKNDSYVSYIRVAEKDTLSLLSKIELSKDKPADLLINKCEKIKKSLGSLTEKQLEEYCKFNLI
ncbi:hypothetical protein [Photobacterium proteolyticum]|uniref:hypothetical protein n=1 Tax=Photobacterium proteolyticum TaxID=1903952 RepID=UPI0011152B9F|nr:hypothetical protein [Photobacterium proteolyticum]